MKTKVLLSAFLLCSALISYGQWTYTNLSYPTCQMGATSHGNKAYFAGGLYESSGNYYYNPRVEIYDVTSGAWTVGTLSFARQFPSAVACGSKVFFAGGVRFPDVYSMVDIYDTITNQWIVSQLSEPRFAAAAVAIGNKVLFAGGANTQAGLSSNVVDIYDITTGQWSTQYLTVARSTTGVVIGQKAYFVGGFDLTDPINVMDIYDAATDSWSNTTIPEARIFSGVAAIGNKILVGGGMTDPQDSLSASNRVDIYDVITSTWTIEYLSAARAFGSVATAGNKVFFAGGGNFYATEAYWTSSSNIVDIYDGSTGQWSVEQMSEERINHAVTGVGDYFLAAGGLSISPDVLHSSVEIYYAATLSNIIHIPADYPTIQAGINAATPGDTVLVADGLYYENINFMGKKPLFVSSHFILDGDTNHINNTIINGSQPVNPADGSVVTFTSGEDTTSVLCGFTITGGTGTFVPDAGNAIAGGGVFIQYSGGKLLNNYIEYNRANNQGWAMGGGVCAGGPIPIIPWVVMRDNKVMNNETTSEADAGEGGGMACFYNLIMKGNNISYNTANGHIGGNGGGVSIAASFSPIIIDIRENKVSYNEAITDMGTSAYAALGAGMGIYFDVSGTISNNDISNNSINASGTYWSWGPGVFIQDITSNGFVFENNFIKENHAITTQLCRGGGLSLLRSGGTYQNNVIQDNSASHGGGISIINAIEVSDTVILINNTVTDNEATYGGGLYSNSSDAIVLNSVIWENTALQGPSIFRTMGTVDVRYSDVQNSTVWPGDGNVNVNPQFLDDGYHLSPQSLLKDVAVSKINLNGTIYNCPNFDIDNNTRAGLNNPPDIGADEVDLYLSDGETNQVKDLVLIIFPNPFTNSVAICYTLEKSGPVLLRIFNNYGRLIAEPLNQYQQKGEQKVEWNGENLPAGIYFFRLQTGNNLITEKIVKMY